MMELKLPEAEVVRSLAALAAPIRLRAFRTLVIAGPLGLTPGAIGEELGVLGTTLSFHLKELLNAGLLTQERDGRNLIYRADYTRMAALLGYLTDHCCQGASCVPTPQACPPC